MVKPSMPTIHAGISSLTHVPVCGRQVHPWRRLLRGILNPFGTVIDVNCAIVVVVYPIHYAILLRRHALTIEEVIIRADSCRRIFLVVWPYRDRNRPICTLPFDGLTISVVVKAPNFGGNPADKLLDDLYAVFNIIGMDELVYSLGAGGHTSLNISCIYLPSSFISVTLASANAIKSVIVGR